MDWITRLNVSPAIIPLGTGRVEILHWAYNAHLPDNEPHRHTFFEVCQVGAYGAGVFTYLGRKYELHPGDLFLARPGALHRIQNTADPLMELSWVSYQWHGSRESNGGASQACAPSFGTGTHEIDTLMQRFDASTVVYINAAEARQVSTLWSTLASIAEAGEHAVDTQISLLVSALIIAIAQTVGTSSGDWVPTPIGQGSGLRETSLRLALRYIEDNLDRDLSVPEIAAYVAVSPRQLSRIFREIVNTSPAEYVMRARLDRAAMLLRSTDRPIKDIAAQVGLPDIHHFTRVFARYAGAPPAAYRQGKFDTSVPKRQNPGRLV